MTYITRIILLSFALALSCKTNTEEQQITTDKDYNSFLNSSNNAAIDVALKESQFWKAKLETHPNQYPYLAKAAAALSRLFHYTGDILYLDKAVLFLEQANTATDYKNSGYLRALSKNYITQHRFKEALKLLKIAEANGDHLKGTQSMLFDVHLELGNRDKAKAYLSKIENYKDFDFLIRWSKWCDHEGQLDDAILYLEKAAEMAHTNQQKELLQWTYTNLADYYGHAGRVSAAYTHYLKALALNSNNAYAKRGIAWIVYAHEKNADEALRILNAINTSYQTPDYHLLKAEIAAFKGDKQLQTKAIAAYKKAIQTKCYGDMYNTYSIKLLTTTNSKPNVETALQLAAKEVQNRPTAESYNWLAWTHFVKGDSIKALAIMEKYVIGQTQEPEVLYHMASIYKATGQYKKAKALQKELLYSAFELGPLMAETIQTL